MGDRSGLMKRLRSGATWLHDNYGHRPGGVNPVGLDCAEAADAIESLAAELAAVTAERDELRCQLAVVTLTPTEVADRLACHSEYRALRKATGGLPPAVVAKGLNYARTCNAWQGFSWAEIDALRAADFEVVTAGVERP